MTSRTFWRGASTSGWPPSSPGADPALSPQIRLLHFLVLQQPRGLVLEPHRSGFEHVAPHRDRESHVSVLLHQQHGDAAAVDLHDGAKDLAHEEWCQPE